MSSHETDTAPVGWSAEEAAAAASEKPEQPVDEREQRLADEAMAKQERRKRVKALGLDPRSREGLVPLWDKLVEIEAKIDLILASSPEG